MSSRARTVATVSAAVAKDLATVTEAQLRGELRPFRRSKGLRHRRCDIGLQAVDATRTTQQVEPARSSVNELLLRLSIKRPEFCWTRLPVPLMDPRRFQSGMTGVNSRAPDSGIGSHPPSPG